MSFIQRFELKERLYESKSSLVLRAIRERDNLPVVLKILKNDSPSMAELARYRREFEITQPGPAINVSMRMLRRAVAVACPGCHVSVLSPWQLMLCWHPR